MGVKFRSLAIGSTSGFVSFADSMNRADTVNGYGPNWLIWDAGWFPAAFGQVDQIRIVGGAGSLGGSGNNFSTNDVRVSAPVVVQGLYLLSQWVECEFVADNADANSGLIAGMGILMNWGGASAATNGYCMSFSNGNSAGGNAALWRAASYVFPNPVNLGTVQIAPLVTGDKLRAEADIRTSGVTTIRCFINGALKLTVQDAAAARSSFGLPAMVMQLLTRTIPAVGSVSQWFRNFRCGAL